MRDKKKIGKSKNFLISVKNDTIDSQIAGQTFLLVAPVPP